MRNDPIYLSQALTCEASLGVLSAGRNFVESIVYKFIDELKIDTLKNVL